MRGKKLLLSALTLAMLCTATVGGSLLVAHADEGVTVGAFYEAGASNFSLNGTSETESENRTKISYQWSAVAYPRLLVHVTGATTESRVDVGLTPDANMALQIWACSNEGDYGPAYGIQANESITADTPYEKSFTLSQLGTETELYLAFYFDSGTVTDTVKNVVIDKLTVDGVSYQKTQYSAPVVTDAKFEEYTSWNGGTNATVSANTLAKLPDTDPQYEEAVDNGAGKITLTDASAPATVEIPLTGTLTAWPTAWANLHVKAKATGIASVRAYFESVEEEDPSEIADPLDAHLFCYDILGPGAWNANNVSSKTEGYELLNISSVTTYSDRYFNGYNDSEGVVAQHASLTKIVLMIIPEEGATTAELDIAGMAFGGAKAPVFINDPEFTPDVAIGQWVTWAPLLTLEQEGTVNGYTGATVSYDYEEVTSEQQFHVEITNFNPALRDHQKLIVGFYTDCDIVLGIGYDYNLITGTNRETYSAGYHVVELDMTHENKGDFPLRFFLTPVHAPATSEPEALDLEDGDPTDPEPETSVKNHIVVDTVIFYDGTDCFIRLNQAEAQADSAELVVVPVVNEGKLSWTYDAQKAGGYSYVSVPVGNWHSFDHWLHINVTLSHETALGVWGVSSFGDPELLEMTHKVLGAGTYDLWLDATSAGYMGSNNVVKFYYDFGNASTTSLTKTITINSIKFEKEKEFVSSPNATVVTVNYLEGKATYDDDVYEVATDKEFAHALASGSAVTPGQKLYIRRANGTSGITEITLPVTVLTEDMIEMSAITDNIIRTKSYPNFQFRLGTDGEWQNNMGTWGDLTPGTEYTIYVRIKATATAFASEEIHFTVKTTGTAPTTPGGSDSSSGSGSDSSSGDATTPDNSTATPEEGGKKGCKSVIGIVGGATAIGILAMGTAVVLLARKKKED